MTDERLAIIETKVDKIMGEVIELKKDLKEHKEDDHNIQVSILTSLAKQETMLKETRDKIKSVDSRREKNRDESKKNYDTIILGGFSGLFTVLLIVIQFFVK